VILIDANIFMYAAGQEGPQRGLCARYLERIISTGRGIYHRKLRATLGGAALYANHLAPYAVELQVGTPPVTQPAPATAMRDPRDQVKRRGHDA
jgi:hypothetical protein